MALPVGPQWEHLTPKPPCKRGLWLSSVKPVSYIDSVPVIRQGLNECMGKALQSIMKARGKATLIKQKTPGVNRGHQGCHGSLLCPGKTSKELSFAIVLPMA